jgi:PKD domain./L,D-transpeptidase catalytic domain./Putative peptidoglycan binding domain.
VFAPSAAAKCLDAAPVPRGAAPLTVTFTACEATHWDFGDGTSADGQTVTHTFAAGLWQVQVGANGFYTVISQAVTLRMPRLVGYQHRLAFRGAIVPSLPNQQVLLLAGDKFFASTTTGPDGTFSVARRISLPGPYTARFGEAASAPVATTVKPLLDAKLVGSGALGEPLSVVAKLLPASAGEVRVRVWRGPRLVADAHTARVKLSTRTPGSFRIVVTSRANPGFASTSRALSAVVANPALSLGARGASVRALERRLVELHYALKGVDGFFGQDDYDAVLAFQKVNGMPRTGSVDRVLWRRLAGVSVPRARFGGDHVEVDKTRQVLFEVRKGKVALAVQVSTGATGNTPLGVWHVYSRVPGWSWVLWYPTFFLRGFAIHGYPDVPAYPASHGCVRVPMWVATRLYSMNPFGFPVHIYL